MNASKPFTPPLRRHSRNPILRPQDMPMECSAVFNCGAVRFGEKVLLLLRIEDYRRLTTFHVATSRDGLSFDVRPEPIDYPLRETEAKWVANRFDMRITPLEGTYYVCHASWLGKLGCGIGIARTDDFVRFEAVGEISSPSNRNAVLFPRKIGGRYVRLERPQNIDGGGQIWVSCSPDLVHWGDAHPLDMPYNGWSHTKTGAGAIPIETPEGWLLVYHATSKTASSENYYLGAMLVDLETPSRVVAAPTRFLLQPEELYECVGQVPNVVFTGGAVEMPDGTLNVYYGGADTRVCVAQTTVAELVDFCLAERTR